MQLNFFFSVCSSELMIVWTRGSRLLTIDPHLGCKIPHSAYTVYDCVLYHSFCLREYFLTFLMMSLSTALPLFMISVSMYEILQLGFMWITSYCNVMDTSQVERFLSCQGRQCLEQTLPESTVHAFYSQTSIKVCIQQKKSMVHQTVLKVPCENSIPEEESVEKVNKKPQKGVDALRAHPAKSLLDRDSGRDLSEFFVFSWNAHDIK